MPKPCTAVGANASNTTDEARHVHAQDANTFLHNMNILGVSEAEQADIKISSERKDQTSKRSTQDPLSFVPPERLNFIQELEKWQTRPSQAPNITFNSVKWGCGGTGPGVRDECLVGWTGLGILMYRHRVWNRGPPHPSGSELPPKQVGWLRIEYGEEPVKKLPTRWQGAAIATCVVIPMYDCLYKVLRNLRPGPWIRNEQGFLAPILVTSGPDIPVEPASSPRSQKSRIHTAPVRKPHFLPPKVAMHQIRPATTRHHPLPAKHRKSISLPQATTNPDPKETDKESRDRIYRETFPKLQKKAGPGEHPERAEVHRKITELPERRAFKSGNATPATGTLKDFESFISTSSTPESTGPASPTLHAAQLEDALTELGITDESSSAAPMDEASGGVDNDVSFRPVNRHATQNKAQVDILAAATDKARHIAPRQTAHPETKQSPPYPQPLRVPLHENPAQIPQTIFDMSANMNIGASEYQPAPEQPPHSPQVGAQQPTQALPAQTITDSTPQNAQHAPLQSSQQRTKHTLNPTAAPFEPACSKTSSEETKTK